ncbi:MAG: protein-export rane protein SecD, partial [Conexibacter sp.]|nr:protein-export rane protein SecD [Conexibacter sp.]
MNRYPVWKYAIILVALLVGAIYTLPNFFGEAPAVQVSSGKATVKVDSTTQAKVEQALAAAGITPEAITLEPNSVKVRLDSGDIQLKAKDAIQKALVPDPADPSYVVALNLLSASPKWLSAVRAAPMYLGLDLRGGVHFMLQVDMQAALTKKAESFAGDLRSILREKNVRHGGIARNGQAIEVRFRDSETLAAAKAVLADQFPDLQTVETTEGTEYKITGTIKPEAARRVQEQALKQNMVTLHNRINELGVAEPVIQQQGLDRIVVQLPGVQDTAKAKDILGRTATLEVRLVDESAEARAAEAGGGPVPFGDERFLERNGRPVIVKKQVILTGENLTDAQPGFDNQTQEAAVHLTLDAKGARIFKDITRENVGKRMAILLFEKGKGEVVTAPVIRSEIAGGRVQISGRLTTTEANYTALLLRAGSLAAPMEIIEEYTIG